MKAFKYIQVTAVLATCLSTFSCKDSFLDQPVLGALNDTQLTNKAGVNALLIGAYGVLDGNGAGAANAWDAAPGNWIYGSVAGGDAHKGSDGADQGSMNDIMQYTQNASNGFFNSKWKASFEGVNRTNITLFYIKKAQDLTAAEAKTIEAEARFLRAHYYFDLKKMFNNVPWVDETTTDYVNPNPADFNKANTTSIWPNIEADFKFAFDNLPTTQSNVARANKWAAGAYLAKTYLYQKKYQEAKAMFDQVIASGVTSNGLKYGLSNRYEDNFDAATKNNLESVFAVQMVAKDGTNSIDNSNIGQMLNFPYNSPFRCCGFYQPSQDLVNSFRTDASGLPYVDDYNSNPVKNDMGVSSKDSTFTPDKQQLDPRLDWTVGRRGIPYLDWGKHPGQDWIRSQPYAGPYSPKKNVYWQATQDKYADQSSWAPGTAINVLIIRYADVLLMAAEAEAQLGNLSKAQDYVNMVRARAAKPETLVYSYVNDKAPLSGFSSTPAANYKVAQYPAGAFAGYGKDKALRAIYFERKIELAMEGHRFFDLSRWGIAEQTLNAYIAYESKITTDLTGGRFTAPKNNYFPIPQRQIDLSTVNGTPTLTQNQGY
ncbi:RagB/SusD family nutrient uptake outer membrane protein [Siphonobacter sp. SORGH_AS_0500]|uniref:RagB/SusD family nutrient uptake outer membrane protein n=1 Tax=Siphonobacter sp. SORGH_AS_0500 TaxID=1864824 RepID=UPI000CB583AC|nr:RagB/SusD family nutrient uptake outer membrane protein [Siphonobacter sp. SORGH_AS_0500]PKK38464.1 RagB/SusD family nutrient uptake outer membrane protein [Siphonobacter sp. SORGH_AS_0500]